MKVVRMESRMQFKCFAPRAQARVPEGLKLVTGVAVSCWLPTLLLSFIVESALPILLTLCCEVFGTLTGLLMYVLRPPYRITRCVPASRTPHLPAAALRQRDKDAA